MQKRDLESWRNPRRRLTPRGTLFSCCPVAASEPRRTAQCHSLPEIPLCPRILSQFLNGLEQMVTALKLCTVPRLCLMRLILLSALKYELNSLKCRRVFVWLKVTRVVPWCLMLENYLQRARLFKVLGRKQVTFAFCPQPRETASEHSSVGCVPLRGMLPSPVWGQGVCCLSTVFWRPHQKEVHVS